MNYTLDKQATKKEIETEQVSKMRHKLRRKKKCFRFNLVPRPGRATRVIVSGLEPSAIWTTPDVTPDEPERWRHIRNRRKRTETRLSTVYLFLVTPHSNKIRAVPRRAALKKPTIAANR